MNKMATQNIPKHAAWMLICTWTRLGDRLGVVPDSVLCISIQQPIPFSCYMLPETEQLQQAESQMRPASLCTDLSRFQGKLLTRGAGGV